MSFLVSFFVVVSLYGFDVNNVLLFTTHLSLYSYGLSGEKEVGFVPISKWVSYRI